MSGVQGFTTTSRSSGPLTSEKLTCFLFRFPTALPSSFKQLSFRGLGFFTLQQALSEWVIITDLVPADGCLMTPDLHLSSHLTKFTLTQQLAHLGNMADGKAEWQWDLICFLVSVYFVWPHQFLPNAWHLFLSRRPLYLGRSSCFAALLPFCALHFLDLHLSLRKESLVLGLIQKSSMCLRLWASSLLDRVSHPTDTSVMAL